MKVKIAPMINEAPCCEDVWKNGSIMSLIRKLGTR
jgi:hypothetical protein